MRHLDLFSGIGGFALGLERAGFETVAFCEIEEYPRKVLKKHWPDVQIYEDVRNVSKSRLETDGITDIGIVTGGFPCQDISIAGKQAGIEAERSGLWSELCRVIGDIRPRYAIVENVTALISGERGRWFGRVLGDLAEVGYDAEWHCIPASELGANHHRDRIWIIAYPRRELWRERDAEGMEEDAPIWASGTIHDKSGSKGYVANPDNQGLQRGEDFGIFGAGGAQWDKLTAGQFCYFGEISDVEPVICGKTNELPGYVDRLKGLGNAVVPQIPELIGRAIMQAERASQG